MTTPKLMLTIVAGGVLLGTLGGKLANPVMKFADGEARHGSSESQFSSSPEQFVDAGPEDLSPLGWFGPGSSRPAEYLQPVTYVPPAAAGDYGAADFSPAHFSPADEPESYPAPEVEEASADAADTAAALTEPQRTAPQPANTPEASAPAPAAHQIASADKAL